VKGKADISTQEKVIQLEPGAADMHAAATPLATQVALPREPLIKIRAYEPWSMQVLGEVWAHRELFYFLIWRDLKVRYKQTLLGAAWVVLQPVLMTLVFTIFLGRFVRVPSDGVAYPIFAYAGLLAWTFLSNTLLSSSYSLISNASLITKVYFPRLLIPGACVAVRLVDVSIAASILIALLFLYGIVPTWKLLLFPLFVAELTLLLFAAGLFAAALNARYRDVGTLLPVLLQLWMFISPVIYPASIVPEKWRSIYALNPMAGILEGMRASLFNLSFGWYSILISIAGTLLLLVYSIYSFRRTEESFADVV
jgi:lipopolysaccharide transport system permease protein